ncbi:hypothetical protein Q8F55_006393 [Vanrija albida]|uniref:UDENN domain-containing protein n=1 Tax=Vanrija albida TaxID=181172 RepID=A0ABR3PWZ1_9TREE
MSHSFEQSRDGSKKKSPVTPSSPPGDIHLEIGESADRVGALSSASDSVGVIGSFDKRLNRSVMSLGAKVKAEKVLGADPQPRLASLYLVSGLGKEPAQWSLSDSDATLGVQPLEDSLGVFWRPDMLGSTFSGEKSEEWSNRQTKSSNRSLGSVLRRDISAKTVPGAGPEGASRLVARTMKYAHPKDVEVVNSTLAPPTTCHTFTFSVSRKSTLTAVAAQNDRKGSSRTGVDVDQFQSVTTEAPSATPGIGQEHLRGTTYGSDLVFHGVTLTVWSHADKERAAKLKIFKQRTASRPRADSLLSEAAARDKSRRRRVQSKTPWSSSAKGKGAPSDYTATDTEVTGVSDSDLETTFTNDPTEYSVGDAAQAFGESSDVFWMPYALTLVSRYPIYDVMQDYLRLSWARYSKDARSHMRQIFSLLNTDAPRAGDPFRLPIGTNSEDEVAIEATMPGALDFEIRTVKVDFQMWPLFQALDIDHILTCVEVALTNSGRVIFCSRHPGMLGTAVDTLKYIVELRGWDGIALPNIHTRDTTFIVEDPGPYIIGIATEARYLVTPPPEVVVVDLDTNSLTVKSLPAAALPSRQKREKARHRLMSALGHTYPSEHSVAIDYRATFPKGIFRNINNVTHGPVRPRYLGERLDPPEWWNQSAVVAVFDRILADKHKKPTFFERLTKSGNARVQEQLTANERLAKAMMRKRALHYVERRDDFELKVARITRRLQKLIQEGEHWKHRFELFEKYAERLSQEANDLKAKIDKEQREARRLSNINNEQVKENAELANKLVQTESARAEAMRQLSDMHHSIQELERERNEIMDVIEMQITNALQHMPFLDSEHDSPHSPESPEKQSASTPPDSPPTSPKSLSSTIRDKARLRPGTRDSTQTRFSVDTQPMSVIGALHQGSVRRGLGSILDSDQISTADRLLSSSKNDSVASRVAIIQAKLELALAPAREAGDPEQEEAPEETEQALEDEANQDPNRVLPVIKEPTSPTPERNASPDPASSSRRTNNVSLTTSDAGSVMSNGDAESDVSTPEPSQARPAPVFRPVVLRPPPRRVTQKKSYESIGSTKLSPAADVKQFPTTEAPVESEVLLTLADSNHERAHVNGGPEKTTRTRKESSVSTASRPSSIQSTMTVTFGPRK